MITSSSTTLQESLFTLAPVTKRSTASSESEPDGYYFAGNYWQGKDTITYIDLFCGIGGFHQAADDLGMQCVYAADIDEEARKAYRENYGILPAGDITKIRPDDIPDHDVLFAGFPCQPFSIIGSQAGFADARGTLFFEIAKIINAKRPAAFVLENVKQLRTHNGGKTITRIMEILRELGYTTEYRVLNALDFGLPQKRERIVIVGFRDSVGEVPFPSFKIPPVKLIEILEPDPDPKHFVSDRIKQARKSAHSPRVTPSIWHENKSGNISSHPFSCALRAGASYNYLLVDGERRLTPREMLRLQGFPDTFKIVCSDSQTRKQAGNSVPVPMIRSVITGVLNARRSETQGKHPAQK